MSGPLLSVNLNKYALIRNSRGRGLPDLRVAADRVLAAGAHGITLHPRRDQRHVLPQDVPAMAEHLRTHHPGVELNVECEDHPELLDLVLAVKPSQCTLVPVRPGEITSDHGWSLPEDTDRLRASVRRLRAAGVRVSLFADPNPATLPAFAQTGADRIELYTGPYAWAWGTDEQEDHRRALFESAQAAVQAGLGVNAGHDLDRFNLMGLRGLAGLREVSIGHAQVVRALEVGDTQAVRELLTALRSSPEADEAR